LRRGVPNEEKDMTPPGQYRRSDRRGNVRVTA